jgi:hypothetical protein
VSADAVAALVLCVAAALVGLARGAGPAAEAWTLPLAVVLAVRGWRGLVRTPTGSSWRYLAPAVAVALGPSLLLALDGERTGRAVGLVVLSVAVVVVGVLVRCQAPLALGAAVATVHALHLLSPALTDVVEAVPRWVVLALAGTLLLVLGATYERRLRDLQAVRLRFAALR